MKDLEHYQAKAIEIAKRVGSRIKSELGSASFKVMHKGAFDLVTEIDIWSENEIIKSVAQDFPDHIVIGEESAHTLLNDEIKSLEQISKQGVVWIVDPIDGTTNFVNGIPQVAVSIGILVDGVPSIGVCFDPCRDELFTAILGQGAFLNGKEITVRSKDKLSDCVVFTGFPYDRLEELDILTKLNVEFMKNFRSLRAFGSAVLDICWVACGRSDAFIEHNLKPWDVAGPSVIAREAGAFCLNFAEKDLSKFSIFSSSFLFSSDSLREQMMAFVKNSGLN